MINFSLIFANNILTILPFAYLCFYPLKRYSRFSAKKTAGLTFFVVAAVSAADALAMVFITARITERDALYTAYNFSYIIAVAFCFV